MKEGNAYYIICEPCLHGDEPDHGIMVARRTRVGYYEHAAPEKQLDAWFSKHRKCGTSRRPDHFRLGTLFDPNHDRMDLNPVANAVNGSLHDA